MLRSILALLLFVALPGQAGRTEPGSITASGRVRTFLVHVPPSYDGSAPVPLVVSYHGRRGVGADQEYLTHQSAVSDQRGFIVVYPDGVEKSWNALHGTGEAEALGVDDVGFTDALLTYLSVKYRIDPKRIYGDGMSNGGFFVHRLGCELSRRFAAIGSVAGLMGKGLAPNCHPGTPPAVLVIHSTTDPIVPYFGGQTAGGGYGLSAAATADTWRRLNGCDAVASVTFRKGDVTGRTYRHCRRAVQLYTVSKAGHTWPNGWQYQPPSLIGTTNRDIDASQVLWAFFAANPKS